MLNMTDNALDSIMRDMGTISILDAALAYARAGASVVFVETRPGEDQKIPLDLRSPAQLRNDDKAAQAAGLENSGRGRDAATDNPARLKSYYQRYVDEAGREPNLGLHVERSGLVVIDADQLEEVRNVRRLATAGTDEPEELYQVTTASPGQQDAEGRWVHKDGGHFIYLADVDDLPLVEEFKLDGGGVVSMAKRYILAPPSTRTEGPYRNRGPVRRLSQSPWLVELIRLQAAENELARERRAVAAEEREERREAFGTSTVAEWNDRQYWSAILDKYGWTPTRRRDGDCACPVWRAPGDHGSDKSATAHEAGCTNARVELEGSSGPLHIWTDNPPEELAGSKRWTKFQFYAAMEGKPVRQLMVELGLIGDVPEMPAADAYEFVPEVVAADADTDRERSSWAPVDLLDFVDGTYVPEETTVMARADGLHLMYPGRVHSFHGESESGKSMILQWATAELLEDGEDVLYVDYESDAGAIVTRLRELGASRDAILGHLTYVRPEVNPYTGEAQVDWAELLMEKYALAVVDGVTESLQTMGLATNNNDEITKWVRHLPRRIAEHTGAAVAVIDHVTKAKDSRGRFAIGGQAKMAALDGAAYIVDVEEPLGRGRRGRLTLAVAKDRPGFVRGQLPPQAEPQPNRAEVVAEVIVDSTGGGLIRVELLKPDPIASGPVVADAALRERRALTAAMEAISRRVEESGTVGVSKSEMNMAAKAVCGKEARRYAAIRELFQGGHIVTLGGVEFDTQRVRFIHAEPYRTDADRLLNPAPEAFEPLSEEVSGE